MRGEAQSDLLLLGFCVLPCISDCFSWEICQSVFWCGCSYLLDVCCGLKLFMLPLCPAILFLWIHLVYVEVRTSVSCDHWLAYYSLLHICPPACPLPSPLVPLCSGAACTRRGAAACTELCSRERATVESGRRCSFVFILALTFLCSLCFLIV